MINTEIKTPLVLWELGVNRISVTHIDEKIVKLRHDITGQKTFFYEVAPPFVTNNLAENFIIEKLKSAGVIVEKVEEPEKKVKKANVA